MGNIQAEWRREQEEKRIAEEERAERARQEALVKELSQSKPDPAQQAVASAIVQAMPQPSAGPGDRGDIPDTLGEDNPKEDGYYAAPSDGINGHDLYMEPVEGPKASTSDTSGGGGGGGIYITPIISPTNVSTNVNTNISYDKELAGDHKTVLNVLFTGLITSSAAMVLGESPLYYGALGGLSAAMTNLRSNEIASMLQGQLPTALEGKVTPTTALLAGGVALSKLTGRSVLDSALILGAGAFLGPVL